MSYVKKRSALPVYFIGGTWLLWALLAPLYRPTHYIMAALASFIAYHVGKMLFPDRGYEVQDAPPSAQQAQAQPRPQPKQEQKPKSTGNPEIDALLVERDRAVGEMRRLNDSIKDVKISAQISHLEVTTGKIIDAVVEKPAKLPQIRKFMNYYLPTTLKLLNSYEQLSRQSVKGENITSTMFNIAGMMHTVADAFEKQLDSLFSDEAMDISADITVFETMLKQEGFVEESRTGK